MLKTSIDRLRLVGMVEGLSYLILIFVAMPMKYIWDDPTWVRHLGMAHGVLFVGFCLVLADGMRRETWSVRQALLPFVASLVPFGPFLIDGKLKRGEL